MVKEEDFLFRIMNQEEAEDIAYNWKYPGELSFYDMTEDEEDLEEFINPEIRGQNTFTVEKPGIKGIFAFFMYDLLDNETAEFGLGINPKYIGNGYGYELLEYIEWSFYTKKGVNRLIIAVAEFNKRAIKLYNKSGFNVVGQFENKTNGGVYSFLKMEKTIHI